MGQTDGISNIKAVFSLRKSVIKHKKYLKIMATVVVLLVVIVVVGMNYVRSTKYEYTSKHQNLTQKEKELQNQQIEIETEKTELATERETLEMMAKNNQRLIEENIKLQDSLKIAAQVGIKPQNYGEAEAATVVDYSKLKYLGEFEGTAYTPSAEECSNDLGITASGEAIIPGVSIAVDNDYWKLGTKFYIEGLGYVVAMDTGSMVKGEKRFDYAVFDRDFAFKLGRRMWNVYLVLDEEDIENEENTQN